MFIKDTTYWPRDGPGLAAKGATVVINYVKNEKAVVQSIQEEGGKAVAIRADLLKIAEARRLFDEAEKAVGGGRIVVTSTGGTKMFFTQTSRWITGQNIGAVPVYSLF